MRESHPFDRGLDPDLGVHESACSVSETSISSERA
jgi:hypothetical protein